MVDTQSVEAALHALYVGAPEAKLRREDAKKARELVGLTAEIERALEQLGAGELTIVDAASGKAAATAVALKVLNLGRRLRVVALERDAHTCALARRAADAMPPGVTLEVRQADVADRAAWPVAPDLVVALHACGPAFDAIAEIAAAQGARRLLLAPCCTGRKVASYARVSALGDSLGVPRHAEVRNRFVQSMIDAERTLRLEAAGYLVEVVAFVAPTVTPHNLLWRARIEREPGRMAAAAERLRSLVR